MNAYDYHHLNHVKQQTASKMTLQITLGLTLFFAVMEAVGGWLSGSLALLSDSAHMFSDVGALGLSMTAIYLATRQPGRKYTFGYLRFEVVASFLNGLALAVIALFILIEGIKRMFNSQEVDLQLTLVIASIGLMVNIVLTIVLSRSMRHENNLSVKAAMWHFIGDMLSSIGILVATGLIYLTGYTIFDPLISMVIAGIIFTGGARIIRESYLILMETVPEKYDLDQIRQSIREIEGVEDVHELHLWTISTDHFSLTGHVLIRENVQPFCVTLAINETLRKKYGIDHTTIQTEHPAIHDHGEYGRAFLATQDR